MNGGGRASGTRRINSTVVICLAVYTFLLYVDVFYVIVPWLNFSVPGVANALVLAIEAGAGLYLYLFCVFCDPGRYVMLLSLQTIVDCSPCLLYITICP